MTKPDTIANWVNRATALELIAWSLSYPESQANANLILSGEWQAAACELYETLGASAPEALSKPPATLFVQHSAGEEAAEDIDVEQAFHALRIESTRLFFASPEPVCAPYEGAARAKAEGAPAQLFVNPFTVSVEAFCSECGIRRPDNVREPIDHVVAECELMQYLCLSEAETIQHGTAARTFPGGSAEAAYQAFLREHALAWMPAFAEALSTEARLPFYRETAALLQSFLEHEAARIQD